MYKTIIKLKTGISDDVLQEIKNIVESAFDNRVGKLKNTSDDLNSFIYEADENTYGVLELGAFSLEENSFFLNHVSSWDWIDEEDQDECFNVLEAVERHKEFKNLYKRV